VTSAGPWCKSRARAQNRREVVPDLRPVEGNKARTSFPWGVGCKIAAVIGVTERVTPADVVLTLNFPTKKKMNTKKTIHRATVQRWPGSGAWGFSGRPRMRHKLRRLGVFLSRSELGFLSRLSPLNFFSSKNCQMIKVCSSDLSRITVR
jgi:hypothetical protein